MKLAGNITFVALLVLAVIAGSLTGLMLVYSVDLPQIADLERYRPITTTDLLDVHGRVFGSFALERRIVVPYEALPPVLRQAVISIEDKNFESHWGVNIFRVLGAAYHDLTSNGRAQGASTLTMQLARNLFLSTQQTFGRKLQEVFLSIQIERAFTKEQIFTLYANQIYLGQGVYGFEAGSEYYFSKHARDLTLPEAALLAALPKGPVAYSPILNPDRAFRRRNMVINSMLEDGVITNAQANAAKAAPLGLHIEPPSNSVAPWFVEDVRRELERQFGSEQVHEEGLRVYTTLDLDLQQAANRAVLDGLAALERRHGWKGNLLNVIAAGGSLDEFRHPDWRQPPAPGSYMHALVTNVLPYQVTARIGQQQLILGPDDFAWTGQRDAENFLQPGDIIYVHIVPSADSNLLLHAMLEQDSGVQGSLMAVDNASGEVLAMVGGRDFNLSQFNRATQAERQTGSSFKPYVYTTAIEEGARPEETIVDAPVTFSTAVGPYTPHNYDDTFEGHGIAGARVCRFAQYPGGEACRTRGDPQGDRDRSPVWPQQQHSALSSRRAGVGGGYAAGAGGGLQQLSQRRRTHRAAPHPQGNQCGWAHAVGEPGECGRVHQRADGAHHDDLVQGGGRAGGHGRGRGGAQASTGRQDGHDDRLQRCLVHRVFALGHLRRVGWLRQPPVAGR